MNLFYLENNSGPDFMFLCGYIFNVDSRLEIQKGTAIKSLKTYTHIHQIE